MASKRFSEYRAIADRVTAGAYRSSFRYHDEQKLLLSVFFHVTCVAGLVSYYLPIAFKQDSPAQAPEKLYREKGLMVYLAVCVLAFLGLMFVQAPARYGCRSFRAGIHFGPGNNYLWFA